MNLSMLDREQLEDILLNPPRVEVHPLQCSDSITLDCLPTGPAERSSRIRHVLAAAHDIDGRFLAAHQLPDHLVYKAFFNEGGESFRGFHGLFV